MKQAGSRENVPADGEQIVSKVRERYGKIAVGEESGCCSATSDTEMKSAQNQVAGRIGYADEQLEGTLEEANLGLGCGAPVRFLDLQPGETLLDLGSGGGLDALLAAPLVGSKGKIIGVDMTPEMLQRARASAEKAGYSHVEFRQGRLEELPVDDASVDAVTSNCVINLVPDKAVVFREVARVLRPGGRLVVSDIILDGELPPPLASDLMAYVGCVAGAMLRESYFSTLRAAGLSEIEVLKDVDYLATVDGLLPDEVSELLQKSGFTVADVEGKVRSVTYRCRK